ncbi:hypothetical protein FQ087_11475 [Sporosarcina sp. ANT_H38]|uniref:hypothetical protein n=1 Tax=Sporosarcina sp. ANT_H38 TaxID=2597358 RepID=UPI0011F2325B|nr:hypothetical protein [Sporosarcina sp. ANT_H38]KAA0966808.1 hypothetical protein FQ087_11475 [Sporosarcina sp. ANT_H38]
MSLFFEDEIQKAKKSTDRLGLDTLMSQDPRDNPSKVNKYKRASYNQAFSNKDQHDSNKRPNRRRNNKY